MEAFRKSKQGFTMLELVMVITIMALLAAIMVPQFSVQRDQAAIATTKANLETMRTAVALYESKMGAIPSAPATDLITEGMLRAIPKDGVMGQNTCETGAWPCSGNGGWCYDSGTGEVLPALGGTDANGESYEVY